MLLCAMDLSRFLAARDTRNMRENLPYCQLEMKTACI